MFSDEFCSRDINASVSFVERQFPVIRVDVSQIEFLATVLSPTLYNEPLLKYLFPDEEMRRTVLLWFFRSIARSGQVSGEIYVTERIEDGAVWISRGDTVPLEYLVRTGIFTTPFKSGWSSLRRCINLCAQLKAAHDRLVKGTHWYLNTLGLKPSKPGNTIASGLLQPLLSRADLDGLPCYLETFREIDLPFYEDFGFRVEGAGRISTGGLSFWAMMRPPQ